MLSDISPLKPLTLHSKIPSKYTSAPSTLKNNRSTFSQETQHQVVLQEPVPSALSTPLISQEPDLQLISEKDKDKEDNSTDSLTASKRCMPLTDSSDSIKVLISQLQVLSPIEPSTSEVMTLEKNWSGLMKRKLPFGRGSYSPNSSLPFLESLHIPLIPSEEDS